MTSDRRELFARILKALGISALMLALIYSMFPGLSLGPGVVAMAVMIAVALVVGWRIAFVWFAQSLAPRKRFLIIGTNATAFNFARELQGRDELGVEIVGFINPDASAPVHGAVGANVIDRDRAGRTAGSRARTARASPDRRPRRPCWRG